MVKKSFFQSGLHNGRRFEAPSSNHSGILICRWSLNHFDPVLLSQQGSWVKDHKVPERFKDWASKLFFLYNLDGNPSRPVFHCGLVVLSGVWVLWHYCYQNISSTSETHSCPDCLFKTTQWSYFLSMDIKPTLAIAYFWIRKPDIISEVLLNVCAIGSCSLAAAPLIKATMSSWNWHRSCTYLLHLKIYTCKVSGSTPHSHSLIIYSQ